jgi:hypothetical protein
MIFKVLFGVQTAAATATATARFLFYTGSFFTRTKPIFP